MFKEHPSVVVVESAYLEDSEKVIFNVDFIQWRKGKPRVRVITEFRTKSGKVNRIVAWLSETDSIHWSETEQN